MSQPNRILTSESVFNAISHHTRRRIRDLLMRGEKITVEIAESFHHLRWPAISAHLPLLHTTGLVSQP